MPRINLLPWREADRKQKRQEFTVGILGALGVALVLGLLAKFQIQGQISAQNERNKLIKEHIAQVDKQIVEIQDLEQQKQNLLARMEVIEQLQRSRPGIVHLFDQMVRTIPDGVYFTNIKQTGTKVQIAGVAQSSTRVSALMRNIEESEWMSEPALEKVETKGASDAGAEFTLYATQKLPAAQTSAQKQTAPAQSGRRAGRS